MARFYFHSGVLTLVILSCLAAGPVYARPQITVPYFTAPLVVDGSAADWAAVKALGQGISFYKGDGHAASGAANPGTTICGAITNESDGRVDLWLAHNATYLYVLAEIHDDAYEPFTASNNSNMAYLEDTLHLYLDTANAKRSNIPNPPIANQAGFEQFGISTDGNIYGENTDFNTSGVARAAAPRGSHPDGAYWQAQCQVTSLSPGYLYTFEERITMAGAPGKNMLPLTPGSSYGFDAEFCDADNGVQLQGYIWWSSDGTTDAWNHQQLWGTMNLQPTPEPASATILALGALLGLHRRRHHHPKIPVSPPAQPPIRITPKVAKPLFIP